MCLRAHDIEERHLRVFGGGLAGGGEAKEVPGGVSPGGLPRGGEIWLRILACPELLPPARNLPWSFRRSFRDPNWFNLQTRGGGAVIP